MQVAQFISFFNSRITVCPVSVWWLVSFLVAVSIFKRYIPGLVSQPLSLSHSANRSR